MEDKWKMEKQLLDRFGGLVNQKLMLEIEDRILALAEEFGEEGFEEFEISEYLKKTLCYKVDLLIENFFLINETK